MRFTLKVPGDSTTIEPRTTPANIPRKHVALFNDSLFNAGTSARRSLLALEGAGVETATVQIWVLDDQGFGEPDPNLQDGAGYANLKWYELGAVIIVTNGETIEGPPLPEGRAYIQVTAATTTGGSVIKIGNAP